MQERDLGRVVAFTDSVMAVAITLLVLNIGVPLHSHDLDRSLVHLLPSLGVYLLSFALIGRYWVFHHNLFERLQGFDAVVMTLNLAFLALIVLMPFATELTDSYGHQASAGAVFGATLGLAALMHSAMAVYATRRGYLRPGSGPPMYGRVGAETSLMFFASIPAAFLSVHLAQAFWTAAIVLRYPLRRLGGRTNSP